MRHDQGRNMKGSLSLSNTPFLARAPDALVLADARSAAVLAPAPDALVLADARSAAVLAPAPFPLVLADARSATVLAPAPIPLVLAEPPLLRSSLRCTLRVRRPAFAARPLHAVAAAGDSPGCICRCVPPACGRGGRRGERSVASHVSEKPTVIVCAHEPSPPEKRRARWEMLGIG